MLIEIEFVLAALAVFRLAEMIVYDDLPFNLMLHVRERFGVYNLGSNGEPETNLGRLFSCTHCIGAWLALCAVLILWTPVNISDLQPTLLLWLALAGAQSVFHRLGGRA